MNVRKHLAGFALFSVILGSAILINHFLTIPNTPISRVRWHQAAPLIAREEQPVTYRVRQVSLDYTNKKSYTELSLSHQPGQPMPETIWVTTNYFSPDSNRPEDWATTTEIRQPFASGDEEIFVAIADWELPPALKTPGDGYFARVYVSSQSQGKLYPPDYEHGSDIASPVPVVVHWPDNRSVSAVTAKKFSR